MASLATGPIPWAAWGGVGGGRVGVGGLGRNEGQLFSHSWQVLGQAS